MFTKPTIAILSAARLLFSNRRALMIMLTAYAGLLAAIYLFVSTREATIFQLILTLILLLAAPALFFIVQALGVSYAHGPTSGLIKKTVRDGVKLIVVSLPVIGLTLLALYGLNKIEANVIVITFRYLLIGVVAPLLAIQLWVATSNDGLRLLARNLLKVIAKAFSPQSVFVYACGFLVFAVVPYFLLQEPVRSERAWLELSLLIVRLTASAVFILLGWITTIGAISILNRTTANQGA